MRGFKFSTINEKGILIENKGEKGYLYAREGGLSGFYLSGGSDVFSGDGDLAYSSDRGWLLGRPAKLVSPKNKFSQTLT